MYSTSSSTATAYPPHLHSRHFPRARSATVSFPDRATSSPGIHTAWTASHIAYTAPTMDQRPREFLKQKKGKQFTGKCGPGCRQPLAGIGSSAGDRRDMPAWPAARGACAPIEAD
jgi:hypothetical protein